MRIIREAFAVFGTINRLLYSRTVMSQLYFPRDSITDKFVAKIPVDEGFDGVDDFDIILDADCKTLIIVAKRKPTIQIDGVPCSSAISASSSLEDCAPAGFLMESELR